MVHVGEIATEKGLVRITVRMLFLLVRKTRGIVVSMTVRYQRVETLHQEFKMRQFELVDQGVGLWR